MKIIEKRLDEITPYENNPRFNDTAVEYVANSIREFGWKQPIVIDRDGVIVAGHTRLKAAQRLGLKTAPCVVADDLTDEQVRAYRLADNKVAEMATWDFEALELELDGINLDMSAFGFEIEEEDDEEQDEEQAENKTDRLPDSRTFLFAISAFGVKSECFLEIPLETEKAERLLERINADGTDPIVAAITEALNAC